MDAYYTPENFGCRPSVGYLLRRASHLMFGRLEAAFAGREVTFMQWVVLMHVRQGLARTAADIGRHIGYDSGALARMVDQLAQQGLIDRKRSCSDRRVVELSLTDAGEATATALIPAVMAGSNEMLAGFSRDETDTLIKLLTRFVALAPAAAPVQETLQETVQETVEPLP